MVMCQGKASLTPYPRPFASRNLARLFAHLIEHGVEFGVDARAVLPLRRFVRCGAQVKNRAHLGLLKAGQKWLMNCSNAGRVYHRKTKEVFHRFGLLRTMLYTRSMLLTLASCITIHSSWPSER